jgi:hypothetical protein
MAVTFLEYSSNKFCNMCFNERAASKPINISRLNTFEFMGDVILLKKEKSEKRSRISLPYAKRKK